VKDRTKKTPTIVRWSLEGSVYDSTSWRQLEPVSLERRLTGYDWGSVIGFGNAGNGDGYLTSGWSATSANIHWSDDKTAEMVFGITPPSTNIRLHFEFWPNVVPGRVDRQRVRVNCQGRDIGELTFKDKHAQTFSVLVGRNVLQTEKLIIKFEFPDAAPPTAAATDKRLAAIGLYSFRGVAEPGTQQ
jgi:hypothetical protein